MTLLPGFIHCVLSVQCQRLASRPVLLYLPLTLCIDLFLNHGFYNTSCPWIEENTKKYKPCILLPGHSQYDGVPNLLHCINCSLFIYDGKNTAHNVWQKCLCQCGPYHLKKDSRRHLLWSLKSFNNRTYFSLYNLRSLHPSRDWNCAFDHVGSHTALNPSLTNVFSSAQTTLHILPSLHTQIPPITHEAYPILQLNLFSHNSFLSLKS